MYAIGFMLCKEAERMNIAVLLAGGIDPTFKMEIPKQFVNVYDRPIIVYTMQKFQKHPEIDVIMIACLKGWENMIWAYSKQFHIDKLKWVIVGGVTGQETSQLAAAELTHNCDANDIVVIHDAIRPLVSDDIISDSIRSCMENGMGIASAISMDNVMLTNDGMCGLSSISRYAFRKIQTPQTYRLGQLKKYHDEAVSVGIRGENDTNNMVSRLGNKVFLSKGSDLNIKINTVEDVEMFKSLYSMGNRG